MPHDDFAFEPVKGLPEQPPMDEQILWQGRPDTWRLAREAFKLGWISAYFLVVIAWRFSVGVIEAGVAGGFAYGLPYALLWAAAAVVVLGLAWVQARSTVYTITTARVAMRIGAALNVTLNIPFRQLAAADLSETRSGLGTIALETLGETRFSYLVLWPHCRPWHVSRTQPALRAIPDARAVAQILADAAEARVAQPVLAKTTPNTAARPKGGPEGGPEVGMVAAE